MRKFVLVLLAGLGLLMVSNIAQADFGGPCNSCNTGNNGCNNFLMGENFILLYDTETGRMPILTDFLNLFHRRIFNS